MIVKTISKDEEIVESATAVTLSTSKDYDVDAKSLADRAITFVPRAVGQRLAIAGRVVLFAVPESFVLRKGRNSGFQ